MSGNVEVAPHSGAFNASMNQAIDATEDYAGELAYTGAGAAIGTAAGGAVAFGIGVALKNPAIGEAIATKMAWAGAGVGSIAGKFFYEVTKTDWYQGVQHELDNNTNDNLMTPSMSYMQGSTRVFSYTVMQMGVKAYMETSGGVHCTRIDVTGTSASEIMKLCDVRNVVDGKDGNDNIDGGGGNDTLSGGGGNDIIIGGAGSDVIHGNNGNDTITITADTVYGDDNADTFVFSGKGGHVMDLDGGDYVKGFGDDLTGIRFFADAWGTYMMEMTNVNGAVITMEDYAKNVDTVSEAETWIDHNTHFLS